MRARASVRIISFCAVGRSLDQAVTDPPAAAKARAADTVRSPLEESCDALPVPTTAAAATRTTAGTMICEPAGDPFVEPGLTCTCDVQD